MKFILINVVDCIVIFLFIYLLVIFCDHRRRRGLPYPPGPPPRPIIGNLLDFPGHERWVTYADMSRKYGDVICLRLFSKSVIVLCSLSAVKDLLEKRGETYSDRPSFPVLEMMDLDWPLFMAKMSDTWREGRKVLDRSLRPGAVMSYRQIVREKTHEFLVQLCANPKDFLSHSRRLQEKIIMSLTYGYDLKDGDKILEASVQTDKLLSRLIRPGAPIIFLPFLRHIPSWIPYLSYEPLARIGRKLSQRSRNEPIDFVKKSLRDGTAARSLASEHLQELGSLVGSERQKKEEIIKVAMGSIYQAGLGTTASSISSLFLALVLFPQVQRRAQAELDVVIGRDRLPTFDDRQRLPYIEALCKELMRWYSVLPMGVAHSLIRDDVYKGYFIPKGSIVVANAWAILHDPEVYPNPEEFRPERFLKPDGGIQDDPTLSLAFGSGRRICSGRHLADATIFMVAVSVLSAFNVTKARDENGREIPVKVTMAITNGIVASPEKFDCSILPRDKVAEDLISVTALS